MRPSATCIETYLPRFTSLLYHATANNMWGMLAVSLAVTEVTVICTRGLTQTLVPLSGLSNSTARLIQSSSTNLTAADQSIQGPKVTSNVTGYTNFAVQCQGIYGINLGKDSCIDAIEQIQGTDDTLHTYGSRDMKVGYAYNVPQRWISCKWLCRRLDGDYSFPGMNELLTCV